MAAGDVIVLITQITKSKDTDINNLDAFTSMPATATDVVVQVIPRSVSGNDVTYDVIATGIAAS